VLKVLLFSVISSRGIGEQGGIFRKDSLSAPYAWVARSNM